MNASYVNPVTSSSKKKAYPAPLCNTPHALQRKLSDLGLPMTLGDALKGGFASSQVYETVWNGKPAVIKHTEHLIPYDPTELFIDKRGHNQDTRMLKRLRRIPGIRVPAVYRHLPTITTTVMEDLRSSGYALLHDRILQKRLTVRSASHIGAALAHLATGTRNWPPFPTNESAEENIYERGLELRLAYANDQSQYHALEKAYLETSRHWVWPDGHPKNILVTDNGDAAFIDFGRSHWGDQRYMLPNFLAHIVIYGIAGYIPLRRVSEYMTECITAYTASEPMDASLFCRYLAMEILHRADGKWVSGIESAEQKIALRRIGLLVFDRHVSTYTNLLALINERS